MCNNKPRSNAKKTIINVDDRVYKKLAYLQQYMNVLEREIKPSGEKVNPKFM